MTKTRFEDFLEFAINNETNAALLYEKFAGVCALPVQKKLLEKMAAMERGHEITLRKIRDGQSGTLLSHENTRDLHLSDYLVDMTLSPESPLEDVLIFSIKAEQKAYDLYSALANLEEEPSTKSLLQKLAGEEKKHKFDLESHFELTFMKEN